MKMNLSSKAINLKLIIKWKIGLTIIARCKYRNAIRKKGKRKTNEPHNRVPNLSQRLDLISPNKHVAYQNLSFYCALKNIRKQYKSNKLKIIAPALNDEFELPDGS